MKEWMNELWLLWSNWYELFFLQATIHLVWCKTLTSLTPIMTSASVFFIWLTSNICLVTMQCIETWYCSREVTAQLVFVAPLVARLSTPRSEWRRQIVCRRFFLSRRLLANLHTTYHPRSKSFYVNDLYSSLNLNSSSYSRARTQTHFHGQRKGIWDMWLCFASTLSFFFAQIHTQSAR